MKRFGFGVQGSGCVAGARFRVWPGAQRQDFGANRLFATREPIIQVET